MAKADCIFCEIVAGAIEAHFVLRNDVCAVFLDKSPLFRGHCLVVPLVHLETLHDVPPNDLGPLMQCVQTIAGAVERGLGADGTFIAMNNRISQSVPHLHLHVVPRRKKDGLRGFFWPREKYATEADMAEWAAKIEAAL